MRRDLVTKCGKLPVAVGWITIDESEWGAYEPPFHLLPDRNTKCRSWSTWAQINDPEEVTNKMYGCNTDIEVTLSGSLICDRVRIIQ